MMFRKPAVAASAEYAWYKAENNAQDSSGNNRHATPASGVLYASGQSGQAFDIAGDPTQTITLPTLNLGANWTIDFYINVGATGDTGGVYRHIIGNDYTSTNRFGSLYLKDSSIIEYWSNGALRVAAATGLTAGTWTRVKITYNNSKVRIYINGTLNATESATHTGETFNNGGVIGYTVAAASQFLIAKIDELKFYNSVV